MVASIQPSIHPAEFMAPSPDAKLETFGIAAIPTVLDVVCRTTGMGFAAVARVTEERWIACNVRDDIGFGLAPGGELKLETTICREIRDHRQPVIINHVSEDAGYRDHPTPALYGFQSYISMPVFLTDGAFFGTLCAIDPRPHRLDTPEVIGMFRLFAQLIAFHLDAAGRMGSSEAALAAERDEGQLREQFIAVLAHDLRNPLAAIDAGTRLIAKTPIDDRAATALVHMQRSVGRMTGLISNVLDFARGRLGGGMRVAMDAGEPLAPMLEQVLTELQSVWLKRRIDSHIFLNEAVMCDRVRIGQMLSNLLGNALHHGARDRPVQVRAVADGGVFELSVANGGAPIAAALRARLFQPFFRGDVQPNQEGLGLGLFIASEIARVHAGTLDVVSDEQETRFTFRMPTGATRNMA